MAHGADAENRNRLMRGFHRSPVSAKQSPAVLDSISQYPPVVIINGLAAILFMIGYVLFGVALIRTVTLRHWSGVCSGAPDHLAGFSIAQRLDRRVASTDRGQRSLGAGLAWPDYRLWHTPAASDVLVFR